MSQLNGSKEAKIYYSQLYSGAKKVLATSWAGSVLKASYTGVVVDEYQDCIQVQHEIVLALNTYLPVRVLGDPLQGIFSFAGDLVDWNNLEFPVVEVETKPWRWSKSNPELGEYLMIIRNSLLPVLSAQKCSIRIDNQNKYVEVIAPEDFTVYSYCRALSQFSSVVYIAQWPQQQLKFCKQMRGFQYDEKQDCDELFKYADLFDTSMGSKLALNVINFATICQTSVGKELKSYIDKLKTNSFEFSRIKKNTDFRDIISETAPNLSKDTILKMLIWFSANKKFEKYRTELLLEMIRSIRYATIYNTTIYDAANHIRKDANLQKRYTDFKFLSSRTLLSKGLEFECVIIDMTTPLSAKDFYVAMTRAMKKIYIIAETSIFDFQP